MSELLGLSVIVAVALLWSLGYTVWQARTQKATGPVVVWRESTENGWSEWTRLDDVPAAAGYDQLLGEVRHRARADAAAVQFAVVENPCDAPDYTLRVLFMSVVWEPLTGREVVRHG